MGATIIDSALSQLGLFGVGLAVIGGFVWLWMRESRAVRGETESIIDRKNEELARLRDDIKSLRADREAVYRQLMDCLYPNRNKVGGDE